MREVIPAPVPGLDLRREYGHHQSPAIRAGGMVFCSGMVAIDPHSGERQHGTVTSEARRIFENLKLLLGVAAPAIRPNYLADELLAFARQYGHTAYHVVAQTRVFALHLAVAAIFQNTAFASAIAVSAI